LTDAAFMARALELARELDGARGVEVRDLAADAGDEALVALLQPLEGLFGFHLRDHNAARARSRRRPRAGGAKKSRDLHEALLF
jgi:hypothetical protein